MTEEAVNIAEGAINGIVKGVSDAIRKSDDSGFMSHVTAGIEDHIRPTVKGIIYDVLENHNMTSDEVIGKLGVTISPMIRQYARDRMEILAGPEPERG